MPMRVTLEILSGPHRGERFDVERRQTLLAGRASDAQIQLNKDPHFSRHHFRLEINPPACHLIDLESMNGTQVNGNRVREASLKSGDVISGGVTRIRVDVVAAESVRMQDLPTPNDFDDILSAAEPYSDPTIAPATSLATPRADRRIPGYELQQELGRGGMGFVYRALQKSSGRVLAVKIMKPTAGPSLDRLRYFVREAGIVSQLNHPHIIRFFEMGMADSGEFFVASEYVETVPFLSLAAGKDITSRVESVAAIACDVLGALQYAHRNGLVHRDVKPTNILLSRESGTLAAKLADFGLAKNYEDAGFSDLTGDGELRGSPAYMAPEQIIDARFAKPACDLYSLGVTMYQMLSGQLPHHGQRTSSLLRSILEDPPVPLKICCPDVPDAFAAIVHRALQKSPESRFASADEMYHAVRQFYL